MKSIRSQCLIIIAVLAAILLPHELLAQYQNYKVITLGTLGGTFSAAISTNNDGLISGYSTLPGNQYQAAVRFERSSPISLGTLGGPNSGVAWPNHNPRAIVGIAETSEIDKLHENWSCSAFFPPPPTGHVCLGFVWFNNRMYPLPTLGGINGYAAGANDWGQVVGWAETPVHDSTCVSPQVLQFEAVVWGPRPGAIRKLQPFEGDPDSAATAINNRGEVVGISGICENAVGDQSAIHPVLWEPDGNVINLVGLGGNAWNTPDAINDRGEVVGFSENSQGNIHAFLWTREHGIEDLGTLDGDSDSYAYGVNNRGQVVGQSIGGPYGERAVIWQHGTITDLNCLTPPGSPYLLYANDIDDNGRIVGEEYDPNTSNSPGFVALPTSGTNHCTASSATAQVRRTPENVIFPNNIVQLMHRAHAETRNAAH